MSVWKPAMPNKVQQTYNRVRMPKLYVDINLKTDAKYYTYSPQTCLLVSRSNPVIIVTTMIRVVMVRPHDIVLSLLIHDHKHF